jgi:hypothetical protein
MSRAWFWKNAHPFWMSAVSAVLMVALLHLLWTHDDTWHDYARVTLGPPLVSGAIISHLVAHRADGADYPDGAREWLARSGALLSLASAGWLALFGMAFYGPWAVAYALGEYGKTTMAAIAAWIGTGAAGIFAGSSSRTSGPTKPARAVRSTGSWGWRPRSSWWRICCSSASASTRCLRRLSLCQRRPQPRSPRRPCRSTCVCRRRLSR